MTFFGTESLQNPYPLYERMRAEGPVHRIADSEFYAVCGWDAVNDAISRPEDFSSNLTATMTYSPDGKVAAFEMDQLGGPTHVLATADDPPTRYTASCWCAIWRPGASAAWNGSSPRLQNGFGSMDCRAGVSNGWTPSPTVCR
ncbi:putative cytochrome P450 [Mycobacterium ulcerans str. Harvey]|uniref:Cytochrome P450 n=1 Tax=Mycobacterium ulcerans str. Harvey TaxID=1299332 RepID=A0ABP3AC73_MYCUL|nr:putative cytochrome P450 [Mycobacterium ulcerans str. Harvey]